MLSQIGADKLLFLSKEVWKAARLNCIFLLCNTALGMVTLKHTPASVEDGYRVSSRCLSLPSGIFPKIIHVKGWKYPVIHFLNLVKVWKHLGHLLGALLSKAERVKLQAVSTWSFEIHLWLQNKQILFGDCYNIFLWSSNSIHSITENVSGLHYRTIWMPCVYMLVYDTNSILGASFV